MPRYFIPAPDNPARNIYVTNSWRRTLDADDNESLDEKLAAEIPDDPHDDGPSKEAHDSDEGGALEVVGDGDLDRIDPNAHGRAYGQIDGTPEDGDSFFDVER